MMPAQMRVVRKPWNYLFDIVLPLCLISLFSLTSLTIFPPLILL